MLYNMDILLELLLELFEILRSRPTFLFLVVHR
jgi:hypothetical protein